jgi:hypothetical protein
MDVMIFCLLRLVFRLLDDPEVKTTVIGLFLSFGIAIGVYGGSVSDDQLPIALGVQVIG